MSGAKHTRGPWAFERLDDAAWVTPPDRDEAVICDLVPRGTADGSTPLISDEDEANGYLIAGAPKLLASLLDAPILSKYHGHNGFELERFIVDYERWLADCRDTIAQAQGEQS
ncbi:MAG: hypothetical protein M0R28_21500 [Pigmentiphaga sp.]|nr:hypothetical protein [Pigmentiphaga sp.]